MVTLVWNFGSCIYWIGCKMAGDCDAALQGPQGDKGQKGEDGADGADGPTGPTGPSGR